MKLTETFTNAVAASSYIQKNPVDLLFLDINMPILNGLDFLANLKNKPMVIITTAHEEYALNCFDLEAIDYLVKPIPFPRFLRAVNRILELKKNKITPLPEKEEIDYLFIKVDKKKHQKIYLADISIIESLKDYIRIKTTKGNFIAHRTLSSFTDELPSNKFIRIHRSFTIALDKIEFIEGNSISVEGKRYTIGRSYLEDVKNVLLM